MEKPYVAHKDVDLLRSQLNEALKTAQRIMGNLGDLEDERREPGSPAERIALFMCKQMGKAKESLEKLIATADYIHTRLPLTVEPLTLRTPEDKQRQASSQKY